MRQSVFDFVGVLTFVFSLLVLFTGKTTIHDIQAVLLFMTSILMFGFAGIMRKLEK